jgi:PAS domain S-box-containing protein
LQLNLAHFAAAGDRTRQIARRTMTGRPVRATAETTALPAPAEPGLPAVAARLLRLSVRLALAVAPVAAAALLLQLLEAADHALIHAFLLIPAVVAAAAIAGLRPGIAAAAAAIVYALVRAPAAAPGAGAESFALLAGFAGACLFTAIAVGLLRDRFMGMSIAERRLAAELDRAREDVRAARLHGAASFETLARNAPDIIARFDRELRHVYVNPAVIAATGRSPDEIIGRTNAEIGVPRGSLELWTETLRQVFETGTPAELGLSLDTPAGERDFDARFVPESAGVGEAVESVIMIARDVTERRRAERAQELLATASTLLIESLDPRTTLERLARLLVPARADGCAVHLATPDGLVNAGLVLRDPVREPAVRALVGGGTLTGPAAPHVTAFLTGEPAYYADLSEPPAEAPSPEQLASWHAAGIGSALCLPLVARGRTVGVVTLLSDSAQGFATDDLALARELAQRAALAVDNQILYRAATESDRAKGQFLATVSHELRTPLNAILGYTELLQLRVHGELNERQAEHLARVTGSARHLVGVIEEILTFSRLEAGQEEPRPERIELGGVIRDAVAMIEPEARRRGLALRLELPAEATHLVTDAGKLRQILLNLLTNALKFTPAGEVAVRAEGGAGQAVIHVSDTGVGMNDAELGRVFEPFWQANQTPSRQIGGTGLGLTVSRRLAELLGGELSVQSRAGTGSTFTLRLADAT